MEPSLSPPAAPPAPTPVLPRRTAAAALALLALGLLTPADDGFGTLALLAHLGTLAMLGAVLAGVRLPLGDQERLPGGLAAAAVFVAWWSLGVNLRSAFLVAGAVVLVREAVRQRATGPIVPSLAWRGGWGRRLLVGGAVLAALTLSLRYWDYGYIATYTIERGDYEYLRSERTEANESAHSRGIAGLPLTVLGLSVLACVWQGALRRRPVRLGLVLGAVGLVAWAVRTAVADAATAEASRVGHYGVPIDGGGAVAFALVALVVAAGALLLLVRPPRDVAR